MTSTSHIYFTANKPHEGPQEFLCVMREITFSDGIKRFIGTSDETPESAWPDIVYKRNAIEGGYDKIGIYRTTETKSTQTIPIDELNGDLNKPKIKNNQDNLM